MPKQNLEEIIESSIMNDLIIEKSEIDKFVPVVIINTEKTELKYHEMILKQKSDGFQYIEFVPYSKKIELGNSQVSAYVTQDQISKLKDYNIDVKAAIVNQSIKEMSKGIQEQFLKAIVGLASKNKNNTFIDKVFIFFYRLFNKPYIKTFKIKNSQALHYKIIQESNKIAHRTRRGPADFIICNLRTANILQKNWNFVYLAKSEIKESFRIYSIGKIVNMVVYIDPMMKWNDNTIIVGRKNNTNEPGLHFIFSEKGTSSFVINNTGASILNLQYALTDIGFNPEHNYSKFVYKTKKDL